MPIVTVGGTASFGDRLAEEIRPLAQHLQSAMIEDCGHYLAEEQPERLAATLLQFLTD